MSPSLETIGIPALDRHLGGGVPKGFTILVVGRPGAGTEFLAKQFASTGDAQTTYFTTTERDQDIISVMKQHGWKTSIKIFNIGVKYYETILEKRLEISKYRQEGLRYEDIKKHKSDEIAHEINYLTSLAYEISKLPTPFRVVVDSLDFFLENYEASEVLSALRTIKAHTQHSESLSLITLLKNVHEPRVQSSIEDMADMIIELERETVQHEVKKFLIIQKFRNNPGLVGSMPCIFGPSGIQLQS
ncbi:MAG: RAD55 family ATPase [Thermoplasmata archaeon]|nr:RAD55 family ATPase [Thermoplasmata archaeon]